LTSEALDKEQAKMESGTLFSVLEVLIGYMIAKHE
jgi:hypothetical protein